MTAENSDESHATQADSVCVLGSSDSQFDPKPGPMPIVPEPQPMPGLVRGLPADLMDFQHQPLQEVEVYRDLGGFEMPQEVEPCRGLGEFEMPEEAKPEDEEDEEKKADDMAEGA